jgi:outer membrane lipoprotein-sorting protein
MAVRAQTLFAVVAAVSVVAPQAAFPQSPSDLARAIQQKYDTVRDFSARFVHTYRGGVLRKEATERVKLVI